MSDMQLAFRGSSLWALESAGRTLKVMRYSPTLIIKSVTLARDLLALLPG